MTNSLYTIIYGKESRESADKIFVNEFTFEPSPGDSSSVKLAINELTRIENSQLNNMKVYELFSYQNTSLWWFFYPELTKSFVKWIDFIDRFSKWNASLTDINDLILLQLDEYDINLKDWENMSFDYFCKNVNDIIERWIDEKDDIIEQDITSITVICMISH